MMTQRTLAIAVTIILAAGHEALAQCPAPTPLTGSLVLTTFAPGRFEWFKKKYSLEGVQRKDIHPLVSIRDAETCERLNKGFAGGFFDRETTDRAYYRANGVFLVVFVDLRDPRREKLWHPQLLVLDSQLNMVATIAPRWSPRATPGKAEDSRS